MRSLQAYRQVVSRGTVLRGYGVVGQKIFATLSALFLNADELRVGMHVFTLEGEHQFRVMAASSHCSDGFGNHLMVLPRSDGTVSQRAFGAVGDSQADDDGPCQAAHDFGWPIRENGPVVFSVSKVLAKVPVKGGTYHRQNGATGDLVQVAAPNVLLDCEVDSAELGVTANDAVVCDGFSGFETGDGFVVRNSGKIGVHVKNIPKVVLKGAALSCRQMGVFTINSTVDGLIDLDFFVDNRDRMLTNDNGGIKLHATAGANITVMGSATVHLYEHVDMPDAAVCLEVFAYGPQTPGYTGLPSYCDDVDLAAFVFGGSIGCTMHCCRYGVAVVQATGQHNLGLEITAGSTGAKYGVGSAVLAGEFVRPKFAATVSGACHGAELHVAVDDVDHEREPQAASFYIDGSDDVFVTGHTNQRYGKRDVRARSANRLCVDGLVCAGIEVDALVTLDGVSSGFVAVDCNVSGVSRLMDAYGTHSDGVFENCVVGNVGQLVGGSASLSGISTDGCTFGLQYFGTNLTRLDITDLQAGWDGSVIDVDRTGSPVNDVRGAVGSVCKDSVSGNVYQKTGPSTADWMLSAA